jgi:signal peptidase I
MLAAMSALGALLIVLAGGALIVRRRIAIVAVTGQSMEPTLTAGDRVLVRRARLRSVRAGQVVVIEKPGSRDGGWAAAPRGRDLSRGWMIKRVAAVPGDPLSGELRETLAAVAALSSDTSVPRGKLVVLGDNPDMSMDSRYLGYIPGDRLLGVVIRTLPRSAERSGGARG